MAQTLGTDETRQPEHGWERVAALAREAVGLARNHVPTHAMFDFAYGGLDDDLLRALYGDHLAACTACQRAVEVYRSHRPSDPARMFEVPEFAGSLKSQEEYELTPGGAGARLREYIARDDGPLLVVAGEANPEVYDQALAEVLEDRARRSKAGGRPVPRIICGPAMGLNPRIPTMEDTVLPVLSEAGYVELYISEHRQKFHFRVSGDASVYTEAYHRAGNPADREGYWYRSRSLAAMLTRRFDALIEAGKARPASRADFVYLSMDTVRRIENSPEVDFDGLTVGGLRAWLDENRSAPSPMNA